jgi:hypothetical protein
MSDTVVTALVVSIVGGLVPMLINHFILDAPRDRKKTVAVSMVLAFSLSAPVFLMRELALRFTDAAGKSLSPTQRVEIFANLYAILALAWGCGWITVVRPWLQRRLQRQMQPEGEKGEKRNG